jgi:protoheme IX farnesyltransferase
MIPAGKRGPDDIPLAARLGALAALSRVTLSLAVAFSSFAGFVSVFHAVSSRAIGTFAGVALLSAAASAVNQIQEKSLDAVMDRTRMRPLLTRHVSPVQALIFALCSTLAGLATLFFYTTPLAALLGGFTLAWYCAVYTPLKRITLFAIPVGALTGALAPLIGCAAATGKIMGPAIGLACFLFFWQVPHFLLMLLKYGRQYEAAGFPYMSILKNESRFRGIVLVWCAAASASTLAFPLFGLVYGRALIATLIILNILFVLYFVFKMVRPPEIISINRAFGSLYLFQGCMLALVIVQGVWPGL